MRIRIINNYKIQSTATATTTTTTSTRGKCRQGQTETWTGAERETANICSAICRCVSLTVSVCSTAFRPVKGWEGRGVDVLSCCNIFMAGMEYLNSYNFRIAQRAAMQRGHRSLQALRECGESRERVVVVVGLI